jgi:hypothetical protein
MISNSARFLGAVTLLAVAATTANAATHIFILPDGVNGDRAFADVSGEPRNADVRFTVYPQGAPSARQFTVPMNAQNFATSPDLLLFTFVRPAALVIARTTDPSTPSVAVLRQRSGTARDAVTIPSSNVMLGRSFNLPLGDLTGGAAVYIGNPNAADAIVDLQYGDSTQPPGPQIIVGATSAMKIQLPSTPTQTNLLINVRSDFAVVAEAVINGRTMVVMPIGPAL